MRIICLCWVLMVMCACSAPTGHAPETRGSQSSRSQSKEEGRDVDPLLQDVKSDEQKILEEIERVTRALEGLVTDVGPSMSKE